MGLLVFLLLFLVLGGWCDKLDIATCRSKGLSENLLCSSCDQLDRFGLNDLRESCASCCIADQEDNNTLLYPYAELKVCSWKLGRYPQVQAFVKSDRPKQFPNLEIKYVRGSDPYIHLLNDQRAVVETLSIEKWNTDSVEEFLNEHLKK
jgi:hypothetical protein